MRILQINAVYGQGSTGTIVRDIEHLCEQNDFECYVASPDPMVREAKRGYIIGCSMDHKLHAFFCRIHGKQGYYSHFPTWNLCRFVDKIKPDIVHLHNLHSNYIHLNMLLKHLAKRDIKTVVTLHDCWFYTGGCFHYTAAGCNKWLSTCDNCPKQKQDTPAIFSKHSKQILEDRKRYLLNIPHLYVTGVSQWMAHEPLKSFLKDVPNYVIHNGIDMDVFKPTTSDMRDRLGLNGKYVILGPASKWLAPVNKTVLRDFSRMMKPDEVLLLYGVYQDTGALPNNVIPFGYTKNREELAALYTMADVFVNTSREDSLSLINVEAQACGTPVVTFDQTGPKETVDNINSFSVPVENTKVLYHAIENIRETHANNREESLRQFVNDNYNLNSTYQKYIELYKGLLIDKK